MSTKTTGELTDLLLYRTRSSGGFTFSRDFATQILSLAQALTQAYLKRLIKTVDFTLIPEKPVYDTGYEFADLYQITCLEDELIHLSEAKDWHELSRINSNWLRAHAQRSAAFAQIGFHFLAVYPTPLLSRSVQVTYILETPDLVAPDDPILLPDEDLGFCLDLAEMIMLLATARGTKLAEATNKMKQFMQRVSITKKVMDEERDI